VPVQSDRSFSWKRSRGQQVMKWLPAGSGAERGRKRTSGVLFPLSLSFSLLAGPPGRVLKEQRRATKLEGVYR
jgi:hypothetical protein